MISSDFYNRSDFSNIPFESWRTSLDADGFKAQITAIQEVVTEDNEPKGLHDGYSFLTNPSGIRIFSFPHPDDRDELFECAVRSAVDCQYPQDGALLLTRAIIDIHGSAEGNGRTARKFFANAMGMPDDTVITRDELNFLTDHSVGSLATQLIELYPYLSEGLPPTEYRIDLQNYGSADTPANAVLRYDAAQLSSEEAQKLGGAISFGQNLTLSGLDRPAIGFASAVVAREYPEIDALIETIDPNTRHVNLERLLPAITDEALTLFANATWQYRKLRARAPMDYCSDAANTRPESMIRYSPIRFASIASSLAETNPGNISIRNVLLDAAVTPFTGKVALNR